jgi:hypothetical protein
MAKIKKKEVSGIEYANAVGKTTYLMLEWKSWKDELPKSGANIYVILMDHPIYVPVYAQYLDYTLGQNGTSNKPIRFQEVRFPGSTLPDLFFKSNEAEKHLHAWAYALLVDEKSPFLSMVPDTNFEY